MHIVRTEKHGTRSIAGHFPGYTLARALHAMDEIARRELELYQQCGKGGVKLGIVYHDKAKFRFGRTEVHLVDDTGTVYVRFSQVWGPFRGKNYVEPQNRKPMGDRPDSVHCEAGPQNVADSPPTAWGCGD